MAGGSFFCALFHQLTITRKCPTHFREMAEKQEGQWIQRFFELDTILDMVNWWIVWIIKIDDDIIRI